MVAEASSQRTELAASAPGWIPRLERLALLGAALALGLVLALHVLYLAHAGPMADDFAVAVQGKELGAAGYANNIFEHKSGRWTGHALLAFVLARVDLVRDYPWLVSALALVSLGATYALLRALLAESASRGRTLLWALAFQALLFAGRPAPDQTQYWVCGGVPYQLSLAGAMLLLAALVARSRRAHSGAHWWVLLPALTLSVIGTQELVGMMLVVALAAGAFAARRLALPARSLWLWTLLAALAGCAATLVAPGNAQRAAEHAESGNLLLTLHSVALDARDAARDWILEPRLLAASLFLLLSPGFRAPRPRWTASAVPWKTLVVVGGLLAVGLGLAGPRWATGTSQPTRMLDVDYTVFFTTWMAALFLAARGGAPAPAAAVGAARAAALAVLAVALVVTGNGRRALADLVNGHLGRWDEHMAERYEAIHAARAAGRLELVVPRPPYRPRLYAPMDLLEDALEWENQCYARYFGLSSIAVERGS